MVQEGKLIVIDGIDGAGKTKQIEILSKKLVNISTFKYPTLLYPEINAYLEKKIAIDRKALFLLFLSDIANGQEQIKSEMQKGKTVILDRYIFSTIAYEVNGITYDRGKQIIECLNLLKPDHVLLLDITTEISKQRKSKQKKLDRYEKNGHYLEKVRDHFLMLYDEKFFANDWQKIDASKSIEEVHSEILKALEDK